MTPDTNEFSLDVGAIAISDAMMHEGPNAHGSEKQLLEKLQRLTKLPAIYSYCDILDTDDLNGNCKMVATLLARILDNYKVASEYELMQYKLTSRALGIIHWNIDVIDGNPQAMNNIFTWTPEMQELLEYPKQGELCESFACWLDNVHPDDRKELLMKLRTVIDEKGQAAPFSLEHRLRKSDGSYLVVRTFGTTLLDSDRVPIRIAGALENISEEKRTKSALCEAEERLRIMVEANPLALSMWDKDLNVVDCSNNCIKLFGCDNKEELLRDFLKYCPEYQPCGKNSLQMLREEIELAIKTGYNRREWTNLTKFGEPFVVDVSFVRVTCKGEHIIMLYARDITEEKKLQIEIEQRDENIRRQAHWYKSILDGIPLPIAVSDINRRLMFLNTASTDLYKVDRDEMLGRPCHVRDLPQCQTPDCSIDRVIRGQKRTFFDHQERSYQVNAEILHDVNGDVMGYLDVLNDITDSVRMARERADEASDAKSSFLATMSHEMRTPLNAIIGMSAIGARSADLERKDYALSRIEEASAHLLNLVNDILDISKIEANKLELSNEEFCVESMLKKIMTVITFRSNEKQQSLSINIDKNVPLYVIGDEQHLAQIIMNLLSNAVKFTNKNGRIMFNISHVGIEDGMNKLRFEVIDNGIGISVVQMTRLFDPFSQADDGISREYGGTGLGLAISKRLVEMMGGEIWVESEFGKGSSFIFTVKLAGGSDDMRTLLSDCVRPTDTRVLVAESSLDMQQYFRDLFSRLDIHCDIAGDGLTTRQLMTDRPAYDICLIDQDLPDITGTELAEWVKAADKDCKIVLTAQSDWETLEALVRGSCVDKGLARPIFFTALIDCVNECISECRSTHESIKGEFAGRSLLLVEDVEVNREIVLSLLEETGLHIECVENGSEAVAAIEAAQHEYDIVFMDISMPVMDGLEATRRIRALDTECGRNTPIVAMTANVFKDDIENCLAAGMNDHLSKPISLDNTLYILRKHLFPASCASQPTQDTNN